MKKNKLVISIIMIVILVFFVSVFLSNKVELSISDNDKKGDLNENGKIDSTDLILMRRYLLDNNLDISLERADIDGDKNIISTDYILLQRRLLDQ